MAPDAALPDLDGAGGQGGRGHRRGGGEIYFLFLILQVENNIIQPLIYGRAVEVHPLIVIVAILIGASLLGILGALLAIPVAATVQSIVRD